MIVIDRLCLQLHATAAPERVAALESRLRTAAARTLAGAMSAALRGLAGGAGAADTSLVFIDRLEFGAAVDAARGEDALGRAWARPLGAALAVLLSQGGEGVRRYPDRAAWLADFLQELVRGRAWGRWWFDDFDGLRPLPLGAALRTAVLRDADVGIVALTMLAPAALDEVAEALGAVERERLLAAWASRPPGAKLQLDRLWHAAEVAAHRPGVRRFAAAVALARQTSDALDPRNLAVTMGIAALRGWADGDWSDGDDSRVSLERACAARAVDPGWLAHLDASDYDTLIGSLRAAGRSASSRAPASNVLHASFASGAWQGRTAHGGAFVLFRVLAWLRWPERWRRVLARLPGCADAAEPLSAAVGLAVVAHALAPTAPEGVMVDSALCKVCGLEQVLPLLADHAREVRTALRATAASWEGDPAAQRLARSMVPRARTEAKQATNAPYLAHAALGLLHGLGSRVPGCAAASASYLRDNLLSSRAGLERSAQGPRLEVALTRPPLHVLLLIAGLAHGSLRLGTSELQICTEDAA